MLYAPVLGNVWYIWFINQNSDTGDRVESEPRHPGQYHSPKYLTHKIVTRQSLSALPLPTLKPVSLIFPSSVDGNTIHLDFQAKNEETRTQFQYFCFPCHHNHPTPSALPLKQLYVYFSTSSATSLVHNVMAFHLDLASASYRVFPLPLLLPHWCPSPGEQSQWALRNHLENTMLRAYWKLPTASH